jgi:hypothetical protein
MIDPLFVLVTIVVILMTILFTLTRFINLKIKGNYKSNIEILKDCNILQYIPFCIVLSYIFLSLTTLPNFSRTIKIVLTNEIVPIDPIFVILLFVACIVVGLTALTRYWILIEYMPKKREFFDTYPLYKIICLVVILTYLTISLIGIADPFRTITVIKSVELHNVVDNHT